MEPQMQKEARRWEQVEAEVVGDFEVFRVRRQRSRSPRTGAVHSFHVLELPRCVKVVAFTAGGEVVLVSQYRHAAAEITLELPAGRVDDGEDVVAAARRELEEETGFRAAQARHIGDLWPDPAVQGNRVSVIVATGCVQTGERHLDDGEDVAVRTVASEEMAALIARGEITHAQSVAAWFRYTLAAEPSAASSPAASESE
jgi:ADP-ribose pyrophosphatase